MRGRVGWSEGAGWGRCVFSYPVRPAVKLDKVRGWSEGEGGVECGGGRGGVRGRVGWSGRGGWGRVRGGWAGPCVLSYPVRPAVKPDKVRGRGEQGVRGGDGSRELLDGLPDQDLEKRETMQQRVASALNSQMFVQLNNGE